MPYRILGLLLYSSCESVMEVLPSSLCISVTRLIPSPPYTHVSAYAITFDFVLKTHCYSPFWCGHIRWLCHLYSLALIPNMNQACICLFAHIIPHLFLSASLVAPLCSHTPTMTAYPFCGTGAFCCCFSQLLKNPHTHPSRTKVHSHSDILAHSCPSFSSPQATRARVTCSNGTPTACRWCQAVSTCSYGFSKTQTTLFLAVAPHNSVDLGWHLRTPYSRTSDSFACLFEHRKTAICLNAFCAAWRQAEQQNKTSYATWFSRHYLQRQRETNTIYEDVLLVFEKEPFVLMNKICLYESRNTAQTCAVLLHMPRQ